MNWAKLNEIILAQEKLNEELQERLSKVEAGLVELEKVVAKVEKKAAKKASKKKPAKEEEEEEKKE